jgi:hypothetical protein
VKLRFVREFVLWVAAGAVLGFVVAAVIDLFVTAPWQAWWTTLLVGAGAILLPGALTTVVAVRRVSVDEMRDVRRFFVLMWGAFVWLATLATAYIVMWVTGPDLTPEKAFSFGAVGVLVWPMLAGTVRVVLGRPPLRPPWWASSWLYLGAVVSAVELFVRAGDVDGWYQGVVFGCLVLLPIAIWRYVRSHKRESALATAGTASPQSSTQT